MPFLTLNVVIVILMEKKLYLNNNIVFLQELKEAIIYEAFFYLAKRKLLGIYENKKLISYIKINICQNKIRPKNLMYTVQFMKGNPTPCLDSNPIPLSRSQTA